MRRSRLVFTSRKSFVFRTRQQVACDMFICQKRSEHLVEKNYLWLFLTQIVHSKR